MNTSVQQRSPVNSDSLSPTASPTTSRMARSGSHIRYVSPSTPQAHEPRAIIRSRHRSTPLPQVEPVEKL